MAFPTPTDNDSSTSRINKKQEPHSLSHLKTGNKIKKKVDVLFTKLFLGTDKGDGFMIMLLLTEVIVAGTVSTNVSERGNFNQTLTKPIKLTLLIESGMSHLVKFAYLNMSVMWV